MAKVGRPRKVNPEETYEATKIKMSHKARLAAFGSRYDCIAWDGGYILYDLETPGKRANHKLCGRFYLSTRTNACYVFNDYYYDTPEDLLKAMDKYYSSLPFDAEIYNPINRKNYVIECAAHDYLTSLRFKYEKGHSRNNFSGDKYNLSDVYGHHLCCIEVMTKFDTSEGKVMRRILMTDKQESWQEAYFTDLDSAIGAINSIVAGYLAIVQSQLMNSLKSLTNSRAAIVLNQTFNVGTLSTITEDAKKQTIEYLEAELKRLKEE